MSPLSTQVLPAKNSQIAIVSLNRPKALNSLNMEMAQALYQILKTWEQDPEITLVILRGEGEKAFCAGGDVKQIYQACHQLIDLPENYGEEYFNYEYGLDYYIHCYQKPILCWANGITMGGGIGMMNGCHARIVTETTTMAMPELTIGFFPDVAASWFLNRIPERMGAFLGLTASRFNGVDALALGLADYLFSSETYGELLNLLTETDWSSESTVVKNQVTEVLGKLEVKMPSSESPILSHQRDLFEIMSAPSLDESLRILEQKSTKHSLFQKACELIHSGSPLSAQIIWQQMQRTTHLSLKEVFLLERVMAHHFVANSDFHEGVRALLVDKDQNPRWKYKDIQSVPQNLVESFFQSPWPQEENPLLYHPLMGISKISTQKIEP